jgi:uncharacterized RDD family membrane protein YckC
MALVATLISAAALAGNAILLAVRGQTVGGWICGARVITEDGHRPAPLRALFGRLIMPFALVFGAMQIPFGIAVVALANFSTLWHRRRRSLLDLITRMRVVRGARFGKVPT